MLHWVIRKILGRFAVIPVRRRLAAFELATHAPEQVQEDLLRCILARQAGTDFGRQHHFDAVRTTRDFRHNLPVATYEYFDPYLERVTQGDFKALLADRVIHMFALTSGTTATRKFIPVTAGYLADYKRGWNLWGLKAFRDHPEVRLRPLV